MLSLPYSWPLSGWTLTVQWLNSFELSVCHRQSLFHQICTSTVALWVASKFSWLPNITDLPFCCQLTKDSYAIVNCQLICWIMEKTTQPWDGIQDQVQETIRLSLEGRKGGGHDFALYHNIFICAAELYNCALFPRMNCIACAAWCKLGQNTSNWANLLQIF